MTLSILDTVGKADDRATTEDPKYYCHCSRYERERERERERESGDLIFCLFFRCVCLQYKLPTPEENNSGAGTAILAEMEKSGVKRTAEEIEQIMLKIKNFNQGSYDRALILKESANTGFTFRVALSFLHPFFCLKMLYPQKRLLSIELKLNDSSKTIVKAESDNTKYRISIAEAYLDLSYCTLESSLRAKYYELISQEKLMRSFPLIRETHFAIKSGQTLFYLANVCAYGVQPTHLTVLLTEEDRHLGNHAPRFVYKHQNVKSMQFFRNGSPHFLNSRLNSMDLTSITSKDVFFLYEEFLNLYPRAAESISLAKFHSDFFLYCIDLSAAPPGMRKDADGNQNLSLITSASVDMSLEFHSATTKNLIIYVFAHHNSIASFGPTGEMADDD